MKRFLTCSLTLGLCLLGMWSMGLRLNLTDSMPQGLYLLVSRDFRPLQRGDTVQYCPPEELASTLLEDALLYVGASRLCPSGVRPLLKILAALPGDRVSVGDAGVEVNGVLLPLSTLAEQDRFGQKPRFCLVPGVIPENMALLYAPHTDSYDSRYFGFVPLDGLQKVRAIFTLSPQTKENVMVENDLEVLLTQARAVEEQLVDNPDLEIPLDPELADYMGAAPDPALDDELPPPSTTNKEGW